MKIFYILFILFCFCSCSTSSKSRNVAGSTDGQICAEITKNIYTDLDGRYINSQTPPWPGLESPIIVVSLFNTGEREYKLNFDDSELSVNKEVGIKILGHTGENRPIPGVTCYKSLTPGASCTVALMPQAKGATQFPSSGKGELSFWVEGGAQKCKKRMTFHFYEPNVNSGANSSREQNQKSNP